MVGYKCTVVTKKLESKNTVTTVLVTLRDSRFNVILYCWSGIKSLEGVQRSIDLHLAEGHVH